MPTFAEQMVTKYETLLLKAAGLSSVNVDGVNVSYRDLASDYEKWKRRVAQEQGARPRIASVDLGGNA